MKNNFLKNPFFYISTLLIVILFVASLGVNVNQTNFPGFIKKAFAAVQQLFGEGSANRLAVFSAGSSPSYTLGNSIIFDNGSQVGIGTTNPTVGRILDVNGFGSIKDLWVKDAKSGAGEWASNLGGGPTGPTPIVTTSSGSGDITCGNDKCVAVCEGSTITLARNQKNFCTTKSDGWVTAQSNWSVSGGAGNRAAVRASFKKITTGWQGEAINFNLTCRAFEGSGDVSIVNCSDHWGTGIPVYQMYLKYSSLSACFPEKYYVGFNPSYGEFANIECVSANTEGNMVSLNTKPHYSNNTCTNGLSSYKYLKCLEGQPSGGVDKDLVTAFFGTFPGNWTSTNTDF